MNSTQIGTILWQKQSKCNAEFFALTYGALVAELLRDIEDPTAITNELDRMGHSIGVRCIEEVLAKVSSLSQHPSSATMYKTFPDTCDLIQTALRMFMGVPTESKALSDTSYTISFTDNPLAIFVELPPSLTAAAAVTTTTTSAPIDATSTAKPALEYSQLLVGIIRGMLEMLQYDVSCRFTNTTMSTGGGKNETNEILVELKQILQDGAGDDYHEE